MPLGELVLKSRKGKRKDSKEPPKEEVSEVDVERAIRDRERRQERMTNDILSLMKDPKFKYLAKELLNIKRSLEEREKALEKREETVAEKMADLELQKKRISRQAAKLARLKNELEVKIEELEKRLEALEQSK
jgi:hypothetical protein